MGPGRVRRGGAPPTGPVGAAPDTAPDSGDGFALDWLDLTHGLLRNTPGYAPPVAARVFGYLGTTLHLAVRPARSGAHPLGAPERPDPASRPLVAHHAMAAVLRHLFPTMGGDDAGAVDRQERSAAPALRHGLSEPAADRARVAGQRLADAVHDWSRTDGGHGGHLGNLTTDHRPPATRGARPVASHPARVRRAGPVGGQPHLPARARGPGRRHPPLPYQANAGTPFHAEAREGYETVNALTAEQPDIARYWSDDPGRTSTPSGHWMSIAGGLLRRERAGLQRTAETIGRLGVAVSDAFVCCLATKYRFSCWPAASTPSVRPRRRPASTSAAPSTRGCARGIRSARPSPQGSPIGRRDDDSSPAGHGPAPDRRRAAVRGAGER